ncbi:MAG: transglycosylase domain-containing protein [Spirochaetia bacterium]|nr:transglycosylase domain-containing protein [Spirochaetia bacterium]
MQETALNDPAIRRFVHRCPKCRNQYRVRINVSMHQIHRAACPHCQNINHFDNRDGRLDKLVSDALENAGIATPSSRRPTENRPAVQPAQSGVRGPGAPQRERLFASKPVSERPVRPRRNGLFSKVKEEARFLAGRATIGSGSSLKLILLGGVVLGTLGFLSIFVTLQIPDFYLSDPGEFVSRMKNVEANRILDRHGEVIAELFAKKTGSLKQGEIPDSLKKKLIFVEDQSFYTHAGIHWPSVMRAIIRNVFSFGYAQGASTLTQQLSRILLADQQKTIFRKLREGSLAYHLERHFSKEEILTAYANHVYLGHGAGHGLQAHAGRTVHGHVLGRIPDGETRRA